MTEEQKKKLLKIAYGHHRRIDPKSIMAYEQFATEMGDGKEETVLMITIMRDCYNLALEDAAKSATVTSVAVGGDPPDFESIVDRNSILKLKI